ncbi:MAG: DUF445 family protein [Deferribacterales bacterium]
MQLHYSLFLTPFVTGFVGYITNFIAIKMLFRPHKRHWYTFGWQGVIPKNRSKLAREIGQLVGNELLREEDIKKSIQNEHFQAILSEFIRKEISKFLRSENQLLFKNLLNSLGINLESEINAFFTSLEQDKSKRVMIDAMIKEVMLALVSSFKQKKVLDILKDAEIDIVNMTKRIVIRGEWQGKVSSFLKVKLYDILYSEKRIRDILPGFLGDRLNTISESLAEKIILWFKVLFNDPVTKIKITNKIIAWKNEYFSGSFLDQLKLSVVNIFLTDEKIAELIENELPKIINAVTSDKMLYEKLKDKIVEVIVSYLDKPLSSYVEFLGIDKVHGIINRASFSFEEYLKSESFAEQIGIALKNFWGQKVDYSVENLLSELEVNLDKIVEHIDGDIFFRNKDIVAVKLKDIIESMDIDLWMKNISEERYAKLIEKIVDEINIILDRNLNGVIRYLNLPSIVEQRINNLNLYQVEGLLFSFMADQFKWINILGFILGFLFGIIQTVTIIALGG